MYPHPEDSLWYPAVETPVCIVTGSSRGIGRSIALALGATGARVHTSPPQSTCWLPLFLTFGLSPELSSSSILSLVQANALTATSC